MTNTPCFDVTILDSTWGGNRVTILNVSQEYIDNVLLKRGPIINQVRKPYTWEQHTQSVLNFYGNGPIDG